MKAQLPEPKVKLVHMYIRRIQRRLILLSAPCICTASVLSSLSFLIFFLRATVISVILLRLSQVENELLHRAQPQLLQTWIDRNDASALPQLAAWLVQDDADSSFSSASTGSNANDDDDDEEARVRRVMVFCNTAAAAAACSNGLAKALEEEGLWSEKRRRALVLPYHKEVRSIRSLVRN